MDQTTRPDIRIRNSGRYDRPTIIFHWLTAVLVLCQFTSSQIWPLLERGSVPRLAFVNSHFTLGAALSVVIVLRLIWRIVWGRQNPVAIPRIQRLAANAVHGLLYCLLIAQAMLGYLLAWSGGKPFPLFGMPAITPLVVLSDDAGNRAFTIHEFIAWIIIGVAIVHAGVALFHHYILKDGVLKSMLGRSTSSGR
jgi:cytochrome b561